MSETRQTLWDRLRPWVLPTSKPIEGSSAASANVAPGLYHYRRERDGQVVRYHLRVENSGQALLLVAAVEAVRLTKAGAIAAYGILEGKAESEIMSALGAGAGGLNVINQVRSIFAELGSPNKRYPIFNLSEPSGDEKPHGLIAPFQADLVLGDWDSTRLYLHSLWNAGIPHVRFLVEPASELSPEKTELLCSAIQLAEDIGMIAGVRLTASQAIQFDEARSKTTLVRLADIGVDYLVVPWAVSRPLHERTFGERDYATIPSVIDSGLQQEVTVVLEAALTQQSIQVFESELDSMRSLGVEYMEVFAVARIPNSPQQSEHTAAQAVDFGPFEYQQLRQLAGWIEDLADDRRIQIIWLPTISKRGDLSAEDVANFIRRGPRAGADISIRVEADGRVIPPRGQKISVGTIHRTPWSEIWGHPSFLRFRQMVSQDDHCSECPMLSICTAQCPADPQGWAIEE